jgi:hypothetical protein
MSNQYYLREFALTQEPDDYIAVMAEQGTASLQDLAQAMIQQGSPFTLEEIMAFFEDMRQAAHSLLDRGFRVTGPLAILSPFMQGVFEGIGDSYDPGRHTVRLDAVPNPQLERAWRDTAIFTKIRHS